MGMARMGYPYPFGGGPNPYIIENQYLFPPESPEPGKTKKSKKPMDNDEGQTDRFQSSAAEEKEAHKPKVPKWLTWTLELAVPVGSMVLFHKLPMGLSLKGRSVAAGLVGASTGGLDYWRQKNNNGKVNWNSWAVNTVASVLPYELIASKLKPLLKLNRLKPAAEAEKSVNHH